MNANFPLLIKKTKMIENKDVSGENAYVVQRPLAQCDYCQNTLLHTFATIKMSVTEGIAQIAVSSKLSRGIFLLEL